MSIPYGRQSISPEDIEAVVKALGSEFLTTGPEVEKFESAISEIAQANYSVAVSSGTAALHCAYFAADLKAGDEVITTPLTFVATAAMASMFGATIKFADIQADTGNIDPESVKSLVTSKTKVIAGVDYAGHPVEIDELNQIAKDAGALFLEDAAHSIGSTYKGRPVGKDADLTAFSFFPTKNLTTGEGGAISSQNPTLAQRAKQFRMHGLVRDPERMRDPNVGAWHQEVHHFGLNYRLTDVLCALGSSQLRRIQDFKSARTKIFNRYTDGLRDLEWITLPSKRDYVDPMWHLYPIRVSPEMRRALFDYLRANGVTVQVNYIPAYWHPVYEDLGFKKGLSPIAENYYLSEISLPMYADLNEEQQDRVIDLLRNYHRI
jgi:UDP-4-amino-4,6-dideoxy-N-acetyl-beta-L-altrosamine transaminase